MQKKGGERPSLALTTKPKRTQAHAHCGPVPTCFSRFFACVSAQSFDLSLFFFFFFLFFWGYHLLTRVPLSFSFFFACFFLGPFVLLLFQRLVGKKVECASFLRTFLQQPLESLTPVSNPFPHHKQLTHTHTHQPNPFSSLGFKKG